MKKITLVIIALLYLSFQSNVVGQGINNFESGAPAVTTKYGATYSTVANPVVAGLNTTANCGKIGSTSTAWYELIYFPATFTVAANSDSYVHILVNYSVQPDMSIRVEATTPGADTGADIRAMNKYTTLGQWQDLVFKVTRGATPLNVIQVMVLGDIGYENLPAGKVLNNTNKFGYIDEIVVNTSSTPRSVPTALGELKSNRSVYSVGRKIVIEPVSASKAEIYELTGRLVWKQEISKRTEVEINSPGVYIVKSGNDISKTIVY